MLKYTGAIVKYQSLFLPNNAAGLKNWNNESNDDENESENGNTTGPGKNLLLDTVRVKLHGATIVEGDRGVVAWEKGAELHRRQENRGRKWDSQGGG